MLYWPKIFKGRTMTFYAGFLNANTKSGLESLGETYPYFLEMCPTFPIKDFVNWTNAHLPLQRLIVESGSSGENYLTEPRALWGMTLKNGLLENGLFLAFQTAQDRARAVTEFGQWVKNAEPFSTALTV